MMILLLFANFTDIVFIDIVTRLLIEFIPTSIHCCNTMPTCDCSNIFFLLQAIRDEIETTQFDLAEVHATGEQLLDMCGEPDRPEVQKNIDDLDNSMLSITAEFDKRSRSLEEALERSMQFQDELMVSCNDFPLNFIKICQYIIL